MFSILMMLVVVFWLLAAFFYCWKGNQNVEGSHKYSEMQALSRMAMICANIWLATLFVGGAG